jgi:hypothetical protein
MAGECPVAASLALGRIADREFIAAYPHLERPSTFIEGWNALSFQENDRSLSIHAQTYA